MCDREPLIPACGPDAWTCLSVPVQTLGSRLPALSDFPPPPGLEQPVFWGVPLGPRWGCVCVLQGHMCENAHCRQTILPSPQRHSASAHPAGATCPAAPAAHAGSQIPAPAQPWGLLGMPVGFRCPFKSIYQGARDCALKGRSSKDVPFTQSPR